MMRGDEIVDMRMPMPMPILACVNLNLKQRLFLQLKISILLLLLLETTSVKRMANSPAMSRLPMSRDIPVVEFIPIKEGNRQPLPNPLF